MKDIEGQILLTIHQYVPTDCIRLAKKSQGMMNLIIENISEKVRKGIMDCNLESPSLEIRNHNQPLFSLTAEEVEITEKLFFFAKKCGQFMYEYHMKKGNVSDARLSLSITKNAENLLTRIKQFKDDIIN